jgi:paraquat-inducible protein A
MITPAQPLEVNDSAISASRTVVCHDCDLLCSAPWILEGQTGHCPRCHASLQQGPPGSLQVPLALAVTACVLFLILNANPLLSIQFQGVRRDATLLGASFAMWGQGMRLIAVLVVLTTIVAPAMQIASELYLLCCAALGRHWMSLGPSLRLVLGLRPWSMVEILMLGVMVSLVKLQGVVDVILGPAIWSCAALILVMTAISSLVTAHSLWHWIERG